MSVQMQAGQPAVIATSRQLLRATLSALAVAIVIVVVAVLPVEYGIDPIGAGKALGLLRTAPVEETVAPPTSADEGFAPVKQGASQLYAAGFHTDDVEFVLQPYDYIEYKYHLVQGASMMFSWVADAPLTQEFHGEPDADPKAVVSYDKSTKRGANGALTAPMTGIHGWFFENPGNAAIRIHLVSSGFYPYAVEFHSDKTHQRREVRSPMQTLAQKETAP
jgi:hypothetical protein